MTTFQQASESGLRAAGHDRTDSVAILHDAAARWRREPREPDRPEFLNVIDIGRARRDARQEIAAPDVMAETRPDAAAATAEPLAHWAILLAGSALLHVALYLPFWREPAPMASIGLETITVDIVLGTDEDAGQGRRRGRSSLDLPAPVPAEEVKDQQEV
ncbi:MAG: hypothetical protein J0H62_03890, partial [Rhizobiales bacterium]|nr:hypothetical protein [Hyphomicrobiales bacterium]